MQKVEIADVPSSGVFHDHVLERLEQSNQKCFMCFSSEYAYRPGFLKELAAFVKDVRGDAKTPDDRVERAIVITMGDLPVAYLTFEFLENEKVCPPFFAAVVVDFGLRVDAPVGTGDLLIHCLDLFLRSCVEDVENEKTLRCYYMRCDENIHMIFMCDLERYGLRELLQSFNFERMEGEPTEAYLRGVDLGRRSCSSPAFSSEIGMKHVSGALEVKKDPPVPGPNKDVSPVSSPADLDEVDEPPPAQFPEIPSLSMPNEEMVARLAARGLTCSLLFPGQFQDDFPALLCKKLGPLLLAAYDRAPGPWDFRDETWAVVICSESGEPVSCATLSFQHVFPAAIKARFEAVTPLLQMTGVGRLLFDCVAIWARYLVHTDHLVMEGVLQSDGQYFLVAYISKSGDDPSVSDDEELAMIEEETQDDNEYGHGAFLKQIGFVRAPNQHDFRPEGSEIVFQREFSVPIRSVELP
jgi:hypothetical protein